MTRRDSRSRRTRLYRIERLETRQMLSADGLSFEGVYGDLQAERPQSSHARELGLSRGESGRNQQRGAAHMPHHRLEEIQMDHQPPVEIQTSYKFRDSIGGRNIDHHRSQHQAGRGPGQIDVGILEDRRGIPMQINVSVALQPVASAPASNLLPPVPPPPPPRIPQLSAPAPRVRPVADPRNVLVVTAPNVSTGVSLESVSRPPTLQTSQAQPPSQASATDSPFGTPSAQRDEPTSANPAERDLFVGAEQTEAVQLVSATPRDLDIDDADSINAIGSQLRRIADALPRSSFKNDPGGLDGVLLDRWMTQSDRVADALSDLDQLLDAIVSERGNASLLDSSNRPDLADREKRIRPSAWAATDSIGSEGMILLLPVASIAKGSAQFAAQVFDDIDDSKMGQWSVGIGFYHRLEIARDAELHGALIVASDAGSVGIAAEAANARRHDSQTPTSHPDSASSPRNAMGVVFCCLGIQYLRQRRKQPVGLEGDVGV